MYSHGLVHLISTVVGGGGGGVYGIPAFMANAARYARLQNTGSITDQPSFHTLVLSIRPLQFSLNSIMYWTFTIVVQ